MSNVIESVAPNVVRINVTVRGIEGNGSGIVVSEDGVVFTCEHVVKPNGLEPNSLNITDRDGRYYTDISPVELDRTHDVAVLKVDGLKGKCMFGSYDEVKVGDECFILGFPISLPHLTVVKGLVSAKGTHLVKELPFKVIQIEGRVNRGNSGGPIIDANSGRIIGIVTMKYIPFMSSIDELQKFVNELPSAPRGLVIAGIDFGAFFNYVGEGFKRVTEALMLVQVGLAWVLPIELFLKYLKEYKE